MARSLGGGGGGGHSFSGGSRSFGGSSHSGGSRSFGGSSFGRSSTRRVSSSSGRSSHSGGFRTGSSFHVGGGMPPPPPHVRRRYYGSGPVYVRGGGTRSSGGGSGCSTIFLIILIIILMAAFAGVFHRYKSRSSDNYGSYDNTGSSTAGYGCEKYTGVVDSSKGYWVDESTPVNGQQWIDGTNKKYLEDGFSEFYNKTGVFPYLYVVDSYGDSGSFDTYEERVYDDLFGDCPGNLLFVFISNDLTYYIAAGTGTGSVVNDKTVPYVIQSKLTNCWNNSRYDGDLAKIYGAALSSSATQLMKEAETKKLASNNFKVIMIVLISAIGFVVVLLIIMHWWKKRKQVQKEEDERLQKILAQPLSTFGEQAIHDLGKKYEAAGGGKGVVDSFGRTPLSSLHNAEAGTSESAAAAGSTTSVESVDGGSIANTESAGPAGSDLSFGAPETPGPEITGTPADTDNPK